MSGAAKSGPVTEKIEANKRSPRRPVALRAAILLALGAVAGFFVGFLVFTQTIPTDQSAGLPRADGIVVLTGAAARIEDAVRLLEQGRARRLLISGVHPKTTREELTRQFPDYAEQFACCIDIDYNALNTIGNALEAGRWARQRGLSSLIIVTSGYHMPRSMVEFTRQLPGVELLPYPVLRDSIRVEEWWAYPGTLRLLMMEYVKYLAAVSRLSVASLTAAEDAPAVYMEAGQDS